MKKIGMILVPLQEFPGNSSIASLLENLYIENEKEKGLDLTVISIYSDNAYKSSKKYKNSKIKFIKISLIDKMLTYIYRGLKKAFHIKLFFLNRFYYKAFKICKEEGFDYIIAEAGNPEAYEEYKNVFGRNKMILHAHSHQEDYDIKFDDTFSNVICVSDYAKNSVVNSKTCINVLLNGINLSKFDINLSDIEKQGLKQKLKINENDFVILFVGRIIKEKGVLELLKSIEDLPENVRIMILGDYDDPNGKYSFEVKKQMEKIKNRIIISTTVKNQDLYKYHQIADIQVIPSTWEEPAGLVAIEGMANGVPIIATRSGGMVEYINNDCAIIVEKNQNLEYNLKNAIMELYNNPKKAKKMGENGKLRAKNFSKEKYYQDFCKLIESWK